MVLAGVVTTVRAILVDIGFCPLTKHDAMKALSPTVGLPCQQSDELTAKSPVSCHVFSGIWEGLFH